MIMEEYSGHQNSVGETNLSVATRNGAGNFSIDGMHTVKVVVADDSQCCNVYVANLPPSADAISIRRLFEPIGRVLHVKLLLDIASGISRGIAFVMFESVEVAQKACVAINKVVLDGKVLQVRQAERSSLHSSPTSHVRSTVVYIRNVPGNIVQETVRRYCEERFGPVIEVSPHPQSAELRGPSPYNMDFVVFQTVEAACACVEAIDGRATFPMPLGHPFTMAKMITDVGGEMRKSILLRRRSSDTPSAQQRPGNPQKKTETQRPCAFPTPSPSSSHLSISPGQSHLLPVNPHFHPFAHQYVPQQYQQSPHYVAQQMHQPVPMNQSPTLLDPQMSTFLDTSRSQRSSMDTSMFQSQRGSMFMINQQQAPQPFMGQMIHEHHNSISNQFHQHAHTHNNVHFAAPQFMQQYAAPQSQMVAQPMQMLQQQTQPVMYVPMPYH